MALTDFKSGLGRSLQSNEKLLLLCMAEFLFMMGGAIVTPIFPRFALSFGLSAAMVGFVVSVFGLGRVFISTPAGILAQRYGTRFILLGGCVISVIGSALCGFAGDVWQLMLFRFLSGVGSAAFTTTAMVYIVGISTPVNRGRLMSIYQSSLLMGVGVGPAVGGVIAAYMGDRWTFFAVAIVSALCTLLVGLRLPEITGKTAEEKRTAGERSHTRQTNTGVWPILFNLNFVLIGLINFSIFFTRAGAESNIVPLMAYSTLGIGPVELGMAMSMIPIFTLVGTPLSGLAADHLGRKAAIVPGNLLAGVGLALFVISSNYLLLIFAAVVTGLGRGLGAPAPAAYVADLAPKGQEGITLGLFRTLADIGLAIGPPLLGWLVDLAGFDWAMWCSAGLLFVTAIMFQLFAKETMARRPVSQPSAG